MEFKMVRFVKTQSRPRVLFLSVAVCLAVETRSVHVCALFPGFFVLFILYKFVMLYIYNVVNPKFS